MQEWILLITAVTNLAIAILNLITAKKNIKEKEKCRPRQRSAFKKKLRL